MVGNFFTEWVINSNCDKRFEQTRKKFVYFLKTSRVQEDVCKLQTNFNKYDQKISEIPRHKNTLKIQDGQHFH